MAERTCSVDGCDRSVVSNGYCPMHNTRVSVHGEPGPAEAMRVHGAMFCTVDGCSKDVHAKALCSTHYARWRRTGRAEPPTPWERMIPRIDFDGEGGCWLWLGCRTRGYGTLSVRGRSTPTHRIAYEHHVGPIPEGLVIDHLCRNHPCCNPAHLEPVTNGENVLRGVSPLAENRRKTHCKQGHEFTPENTYVDKNGGRSCRACGRAYAKRRKSRARVLADVRAELAASAELVRVLMAAAPSDIRSIETEAG